MDAIFKRKYLSHRWESNRYFNYWSCCIVTTNYTHTFACGNSQHNKDDRTQFFRKIYLSLYSKGLRKGYCVRGGLATEQRLQHIDPSSSGYSSTSFSSCGAAQPGNLVLTPSNCNNWLQALYFDLQLTHFLSHPGYIIVLRPPASCGVSIRTQFNPSIVKVIPWYLRPDAPVYTGAFFIWQLGRVGGQYVTVRRSLVVMAKRSIKHSQIL